MSTVASHSCDNLTGITTIINTGTVDNETDGGKTFIRVTGAGAWENGFSWDNTFTGEKNQCIYFTARVSDDNFMCCLSLSSSVAIADYIGVYFTGGSAKMWTGAGTIGDITATVGNWHDILIIIAGNGDLQGYYHAHDGTAFSDITNWTYIGNILAATNFNPLGQTLFFCTSYFTSGETGDIDNITLTDNGWTGDKPEPSLIWSNEIDTYDEFTEVETGGTNEIVTDGGRTYSSSIGNGSWNTTGIFTTEKIGVGARGAVLYVDFKGGDTVNPNVSIHLRQDAAITYTTNTAPGFYQNAAAQFIAFNYLSIGSTPPTFTNFAWINLRFVFEVSGRIVMSFHEDDGTLPWELDEADWTWVANSATSDFEGSDIFLSNNHFLGTAGCDSGLDRAYFTADGTLTVEATGGCPQLYANIQDILLL
jgi:hypothetical protein